METASPSAPASAESRPPLARSQHVDLDGAWPPDLLGEGICLEARAWGPPLRYSTTRAEMGRFFEFAAAHPAQFTLFGSGDFHHLAAVWLARLQRPYTLVSFDNHPDWDIRPPHWCCGTWISRALESPLLRRAVIWGCGNFELDRPNSFFANHRGLRSGRLAARPWAERLKPATRPRWPTLTRENWRAEFTDFAKTLAGEEVYITVDLDCLAEGEAVTNWESGLFTAAEVAWAIRQVREAATVVGGDLCGAYSEEVYARFRQRIEGRLDHPKHAPIDAAAATACNVRAWRAIWPALTGEPVAP